MEHYNILQCNFYFVNEIFFKPRDFPKKTWHKKYSHYYSNKSA